MRNHIGILLAGLLVTPALAQDQGKTPPAKQDQDEAKITERPESEVLEEIDSVLGRISRKGGSDFPALEKERKRRAVRDLGLLPHPKTVDALKKILGNKKNEAFVRGAAAEAMGHMKFDRKNVAKYLTGQIKKEWKEEDILIGIANALGGLGEIHDREEMYRYFNHASDKVYVSMIECLGALKDVQSLPKLGEIFATYGKVSTAGVNVRVDTGAAGTKDQREAERRGRSKMRKAKTNRRAGGVAAVTNAIEKITGEKFDYSDKFSEWLKENEKRLGLDKKSRKRR